MATLREDAARDLAEVLHPRHVLEVGVRLEDDEPPALLGPQDLERLWRVPRRDDPVRHLCLQVHGRLLVHNVRQRRPVSEGAHGVGVARAEVGERRGGEVRGGLVRELLHVGEGDGHGGASGRHVLERRGGGEAEGLLGLLDEGPRVDGVEQVDVARLAVEDLEGQRPAVHRVDLGGQLVRVAAVLEGEGGLVGAGHDHGLLAVLLREPVGDGRVVGGALGEGRGRERAARLHRRAPVLALEVLDHPSVLLGVSDDDDRGVVLGGGADHGGAADVDVLDTHCEVAALLDVLLKGVQVDDEHVDLVDPVVRARLLVLGVAADREEAAVHLGVQRLDAPVHHLGELGVVRHIGNREAGIGEGLGGAAGGEDLHAEVLEGGGDDEEVSLVRDRDQGPLDGHEVSGSERRRMIRHGV
mmetsp:Transcript_50539/g.123252  ORF Transcript_50539/g.123252 Transcript_50539/m.123252 type:complete len:413 (-) Transcript_50539:57-1295(-)